MGFHVKYAVFALVFALVSAAGLAVAEQGEVRLELLVPPTAGSEDALREITREAADRVRARLETARVKDFEVVTRGRAQIHVVVRGRVDRGELASLVVPSGAMAIRPVVSVGDVWIRRAAALPEGLELRQPAESMRADDAYLWGRSRAALLAALGATPPAGVAFAVYPEEGGWRSVAMGPPVATHRSVIAVKAARSDTGEPYVSLSLDALRSEPEPIRGGASGRWAMVLDGEVVRLWESREASAGTSIRLLPPRHLEAEEARRSWARLVAGRLSAYIPVALTEVEGPRAR